MAQPKNQLLKLTEQLSIPEALTKHSVIPFLNEKSLYALTWSCKSYQNQYKDKHADKKVAAEMLHCVLNPTLPNQAKFLKLLATPKQDKNGQPLYLIQNHGEEVYFNKGGVRKTKTIRYSTNVLETILRTKNIHLAKTLFNCIPKHEKTENLKKYISTLKSQEIWGIPELQLAYKNILDTHRELTNAKKWHELDKLSGHIGHAQKNHLPWFSIYLFCHPVSRSKVDYTKAPNWTCILFQDLQLDFDYFGNYTLYKSDGPTACAVPGHSNDYATKVDSEAFASQSKVLSTEMDKIIKQYGLDDSEPGFELDATPAPAIIGEPVCITESKQNSKDLQNLNNSQQFQFQFQHQQPLLNEDNKCNKKRKTLCDRCVIL